MNLERIKENKVKVIFQFSVPAIIAMILTAMITVIDGFFIGNYVGSEGMAAVNLGLPIVYLFLAIGLMLSIGGMVIAGIEFGKGNIKEYTQAFNQTIALTAIVSISISIIVFICFKPMLSFLHASNIVSSYFTDYYKIILLELPIMIINSAMGMFIRGEGNPQFYMKINILTVVLNIILDYLFTYKLGLGISGIAFASLIAAFIALLISIWFFIKKAKVYHFHAFKFSKDIVKSTIMNGSSEFIGEMSMCISIFAYNLVLMRKIGIDGVTAFTIVGYVSYIFSMIIIGFGQGISPIISFVFGASNSNLARDIRKITNKVVLCIGVVVVFIMTSALGWYSELFVKTIEVQKMIHSGMIIFMISFLFSGVNTISSFYFTSIGKAKESAIISFSRGFVVLLISIFLLPEIFGMTGIWLAAPITEAVTIIITFYFIFKEKNYIL